MSRRNKRPRKHTKGTCPITKKYMLSENVARKLVNNNLDNGDINGSETRYYRCECCDSYHTTKMSLDIFEKIKNKNNPGGLPNKTKEKSYKPKHKNRWQKLLKNDE